MEVYLRSYEKTTEESNEALLNNIDALHTTELGAERIRKNADLGDEDVICWCKMKITDKNAKIMRKGKNWYIENDGYVITVNAKSYTVITVH